MGIPKGGRGKKAPYETIMVRIPVELKSAVSLLSATYKLLSVEGKREKIIFLKGLVTFAVMQFYPGNRFVSELELERLVLASRYSNICDVVDSFDQEAEFTDEWKKANELLAALRSVINPSK